MAHDLKASHYVSLRKSTRADWVSYEENFDNVKGTNINGMHNSRNAMWFETNNGTITKACFAFWHANKSNARCYSTGSANKKDDDNKTDVSTSQATGKTDEAAPLSRKDMLKKAMKDYGSTVIIFHVGISLISLGSFYLLVSR